MPIGHLASAHSPADQAETTPGGSRSEADSGNLAVLLEKNLKWSQIIYEQTRKTNRRLFWMAVGSWVKVVIILIPLALAVWFLPSAWRKLEGAYGSWFKQIGSGQPAATPLPVEQLLKFLPLSPEQQQQLKAFIK